MTKMYFEFVAAVMVVLCTDVWWFWRVWEQGKTVRDLQPMKFRAWSPSLSAVKGWIESAAELYVRTYIMSVFPVMFLGCTLSWGFGDPSLMTVCLGTHLIHSVLGFFLNALFYWLGRDLRKAIDGECTEIQEQIRKCSGLGSVILAMHLSALDEYCNRLRKLEGIVLGEKGWIVYTRHLYFLWVAVKALMAALLVMFSMAITGLI